MQLRALCLSFLAASGSFACGGGGPLQLKAYAGPERPSQELAVLTHVDALLHRVDGRAIPFCDDGCELLLVPGRRHVLVQYWHKAYQEGFYPQVSDNTVTVSTQGAMVLQVKSRHAREVAITVEPEHRYMLLAHPNLALDDWSVQVFDEKTGATVFSDRASHCRTCEPETASSP